jgi:hypothetical protein
MAVTITKLAKPLPRFEIPVKKYNGADALCSPDQYLQGSFWQANGSPTPYNMSTFGAEYAAGRTYFQVLGSGVGALNNLLNVPLKLYIEIEEFTGDNWAFVLYGNQQAQEYSKGAFLIEATPQANLASGLYFGDSFWHPDPTFKNVPVGLFPTTTTLPWYEAGAGEVRKMSDGRVSLSHNGGALHSRLMTNLGITDGTLTEFTITVDYVSPGGNIQLYIVGAGRLTITQPGTYTLRYAYTNAQTTIVTNGGATGQPPSIISRYEIKSAIARRKEGNLFIKPKRLVAMESSLFDSLVNPAEIVAANQVGPAQPQTNIVGFSDKQPVAGYYRQGDIVRNVALATGLPVGWKCIASGSPGNWIALPSIP